MSSRGDGLKYALKYNAFHNLESIGVDGMVDQNGEDIHLINYTYKNGNGRLKEMTYANGDRMNATYNGIGQMVAEKWYNASNELAAHYKYVYDGQGNIVRSIDILGQKEYNYEYDAGKVVRATESDIVLSDEMVVSKSLVNTVKYYYDADDKMTKKAITPASGSAQTIYYENSEDNTVVKFNAGGKTITAHSKTDSFGRKVFDELQLGTGFVSRQFHYHAGVATEEHADNNMLKSSPTTQLVSQIVLSGGRTISYEYDEEERITKVDDSVDGITTYTYDALGQLVTETVNGINTKFEYDNYGNILAKGVVDETGEIAEATKITYAYGDEHWHDLLTAYNGQSITYDAQGNPTSYLGHELTWEKGRQLKSFDNIAYTYNANGIRTSKTVDGIKHTYTLDGTKILREEWNGNTLIPLYDNEETVCGILYNNEPYYFQKNLQGDIIGIVDKSSKVVANYSYDAWGVCSIAQDSSNCQIATINPYRYRGYYFDEEIGMYYLQSRYYNPTIGRFVNSDEFENLGYTSRLLAYNLYTYCDNDSINNTDDEGKAIWSIVAKILIGILSQYAGDIITNIINRKTGWKVFKPVSSVGTYISAAITSLFKGGKILKNIATSFVTQVIKAIENAIKGVKQSIWRILYDFAKQAFFGILGDFISSAISSKIMSLTPSNYSKFAHSQYLKNANITPNQIRTKMKKLIGAGIKASNAINFLIDSAVSAVP